MAMPRNFGVSKVVALVVALAKLHNFCIGESNIPEHLPRMHDKDRLHMMNSDGGYILLCNDDSQQNTPVPTELMHLGEHFDDVPSNILRSLHRQSTVNAGNELPQTVLYQAIADGHWQRPTRVVSRRN